MELPVSAEHSLLRLTGEALFNTAVHGEADRAEVQLTYAPDRVVLAIADDGTGALCFAGVVADPAE